MRKLLFENMKKFALQSKMDYTPFFISNTFISNPRLKLAKIKQMLSNTLWLNFCYLKIIHILYPRYHPKVMDIFYKIIKRTSICVHTVYHNENQGENEKKIR